MLSCVIGLEDVGGWRFMAPDKAKNPFLGLHNSSMSLTANNGSGIHTYVASELPKGHWAATERTCIWYQSK